MFDSTINNANFQALSEFLEFYLVASAGSGFESWLWSGCLSQKFLVSQKVPVWFFKSKSSNQFFQIKRIFLHFIEFGLI